MGNGEAGDDLWLVWWWWLVMSPVIEGTGQLEIVMLVNTCGWCGGGDITCD